eukprot:scaffold359342_cov24-Prasinocladus_malaysianus.AAC.1
MSASCHAWEHLRNSFRQHFPLCRLQKDLPYLERSTEWTVPKLLLPAIPSDCVVMGTYSSASSPAASAQYTSAGSAA